MKKLILFLAILLPVRLFAQGVQFDQSLTFAQLKAKAKAEHKFIFLDCFATWCGPCKMMDQQVYPQQLVGDFMNSHFVSLQLQMDKTQKDDENTKLHYADAAEITAKHQIEGLPTFLFFDSEGNLVDRDLGFQAPADFLKIADRALHSNPNFTARLASQKSNSDQKAKTLLARLTLPEKISLLSFEGPAIMRLGLPAYTWWNEGLHGVARAGEATVFPQAIGMAASFDPALLRQVADAISTEGRAKYNLFRAGGHGAYFMGITFWSPNINIFRDPRWGRGQETYGEDPFLTGTMGTAYVKGIQGNDPYWLKGAACAKHYVVHSGPEAERHSFNALVDEKDLRETYLPAFHSLVNAGVASLMCAYNRVNGQACCTSGALLKNILLDEWQYKGQVVTDCGALDDIMGGHQLMTDKKAVAAAAVREGVDLECGGILTEDVQAAIDAHLLDSSEVDKAVLPTLKTAMRLGIYQNPQTTPFAIYGDDSVHNSAHIELAKRMAEESMVLLKNNGVLPLKKDSIGSIYVTGPNAASVDALTGNYHGTSSRMVTFAEGLIKAGGPGCAVNYEPGCDNSDTSHFTGMMFAGISDVTVAVLGLDQREEGEEGDAFLAAAGGDRTSLGIPKAQLAYLKALRKNSPHLIVVLTSGSDLDVAEISSYADAVILAWYPGEQGGTALANILFGKVSPSGRLPVTFYKSLNDVPAFKDYSMKGRTYRYFKGEVQYPFGYGLSYTSFDYKWAAAPKTTYQQKDIINIKVAVKNTGNMDAAEVVQAYINYPNGDRMPVSELKAFQRVAITKGGTVLVPLTIPISALEKWDMSKHQWRLYPGKYTVSISKNANESILKQSFTIR